MTTIASMLAALIIACGWAPVSFAQTNPQFSANRAMQIAQARQNNAALMHQYNWNSRTEIIVDGQVKDVRIQLVSYAPNGQLMRTTMNDQPASGTYLPTPIGFLRRAVANDRKEEMEKFLTGLQGLIEQYTLPTAGKILDFMTAAKPSGPDAAGMFTLTGSNVIQPGDTLAITVNPWTQHVTQVQVNSAFEGQAVQVHATYATVPVTGLNYVSFAEATVPGKQLSVQVQNYNYQRY